MWGIWRTRIYKEVRYMNVSLMLLILVAYLQDSGVLWTVKSVLGPVETLVLSRFCAELCQYNCVPL